MSTCDRLDLGTLGSQPIIMSKNLPGHWIWIKLLCVRQAGRQMLEYIVFFFNIYFFLPLQSSEAATAQDQNVRISLLSFLTNDLFRIALLHPRFAFNLPTREKANKVSPGCHSPNSQNSISSRFMKMLSLSIYIYTHIEIPSAAVRTRWLILWSRLGTLYWEILDLRNNFFGKKTLKERLGQSESPVLRYIAWQTFQGVRALCRSLCGSSAWNHLDLRTRCPVLPILQQNYRKQTNGPEGNT